jgi:hypothetical protein
LGDNASAAICDVANGARLHTGFLAEKYQRCFQYFRSADRSTLKRAFPSIKTIKIVRHVRNLNARKQSRQAEYDRLTALPWWVRMGTISGAMTLSLSHDPATKLAR